MEAKEEETASAADSVIMSEEGEEKVEEEAVPDKKKGIFIEAAALLAHVQDLESSLPEDGTQFGHPPPPQLYMCRIPTREPGFAAMMAVTKRCISIQLLKETTNGVNSGEPVEVLVLQGDDQITCATILALESPWLSAPDKLIVPDRNQGPSEGTSLMSGGLVPVAPPPRVAVVLGTDRGRIISVEFSVKPKSMQLSRRNYYSGNDVLTYYEPLPFGTLTNYQRSHRRGVPGPDGGKPRRIVPFEPSDAVCSLVPYTVVSDGKMATHLWIAYGDGTGVRVHHAAFFASVIQKHTESQPNAKTLETLLGSKVVRWEARLPPMEATTFTLVPVPKYHPSPLAPFPAWKKPEFDDTGVNHPNEGGKLKQFENYEAVVYCSGAMADSFPTLAFYTSEDQVDGRVEEPEDDDEETEASPGIISSVIGGIFNILVGSNGAPPPNQPQPSPKPAIPEKPNEWDPNVPCPSINLDPFKLFSGSEIHDPPRRVTQCTVDPEGDLAAISDTLGRISLVDLSTKQIIRMWKGFRDTSCYWMEVPRKTVVMPGQKTKTLYLVIHSRQRKVVEIWRTRHGPKVKSMQVHREAQIVSVRELSPMGYIANCYLAHSNVPFSKMNQVERITIDVDESAGIVSSERNRHPRPDLTLAPQDAAARLNRLKQLLSDTNVECQSIDVFKALERIKSIEDLATALDTLASSPTLERKMGVEGSTFQQLAVSHCKQKLDEALNAGGQEAFSNPHVQLLAFKIAYYTQVSKAYDVLHRHETSSEVSPPSDDAQAPSHWGTEAMSWTTVYEKITRQEIDSDIPGNLSEPMKFHEFTGALDAPKKFMEEDFVLDNGGYKIYFSDSTRTRREILIRIFKPLLGDVFSFSAVSQIFDALGTKCDGEFVMKCFGEWFSTLPIKQVAKRVVFSENSPVKRWLRGRITAQLNDNSSDLVQPMESIYQYCRKSEELIRAFWLAALCYDAICPVAQEQEEKTYGKISRDQLVSRWEGLLRQLRVCLLVSLRLHGIQLGPLPVSVHEVDKAEEFSVFEWLAHDELSMSHKHDEIVSLENACRISSRAFDASTSDGDAPERLKILQNSCLSSALSEEERAEYLVDFDDDERLGALLLYLRHYNMGKILVAHRALLLAARWGKQPHDLELLQDAVVALKAIDAEEFKRISSAVRLEIWQARIRPVYRALMFGFDDVHEVSPEAVSPLFQDVGWVKSFSNITSTVLEMLHEFEWHGAENLNLQEEYIQDSSEGRWPALEECPILAKLVDKNKRIRESSFEAHQMLMTALKVTQDFTKLARCIPSFYDLFTPGALFQKAIPVEDAEENQQALMQDAVVAFAKNYYGPSMDKLDLGDIEVLSELFAFEMDNIRTLFLLAMYEYGKDRMVDSVITRSAPAISVVYFCAGGVEIICRRLNYLLHVDPSEDMKSIMGTLDANMCEWIKEKAENSESLVENGNLAVPPGNTHLFALRLLSLGASADIDKKERIQIHSLIVLSGSIVKGLEALHQESKSPQPPVQLPPSPVSQHYNAEFTPSGKSLEGTASMLQVPASPESDDHGPEFSRSASDESTPRTSDSPVDVQVSRGSGKENENSDDSDQVLFEESDLDRDEEDGDNIRNDQTLGEEMDVDEAGGMQVDNSSDDQDRSTGMDSRDMYVDSYDEQEGPRHEWQARGAFRDQDDNSGSFDDAPDEMGDDEISAGSAQNVSESVDSYGFNRRTYDSNNDDESSMQDDSMHSNP